jgi:hypothetical protein
MMNTNRHEQLLSALQHEHRGRARAGQHLPCCLTLLAFALAVGTQLTRAQEKMFVLAEATENQPYSAQVATAGTAPYTWVLLEGTIPPGLAFATDGKLSGMPTAHSTTPYRFKVRVTDSSVPPRTGEQWLSLAVLQPPAPPPLIGTTGTEVPAPTPLPTPFVLTTSTADEETIALTQQFASAPAAPDFTADTDPTNVGHLKAIIGGSIGTSIRNFEPGDYCVLHVIRWKSVNSENKSEPERELWALFKSKPLNATDIEWEPQIDPKNKDVFATRIFGHRRVAVLLVHLDTPSAWDVKYKVSVNQKVPSPLQHVLELASAILGGGAARNTKNIWGARMMLIRYESSELVVKVNAVTAGSGGRPIEQSKEHTNTFVNEGRYHWDVSVGLPVRSVRELRFKSDGNRVFAESKEKQSVYGFLHIYPKAVDLKGDSYLTWPHFVFGVPLASKPLQRPFAGLGTGIFKMPIKFNIFAGIVFIRERVPQTLGEGATATTGQLEGDLRPRWVRKFMFGINLPVSQIKDAIKSK